MLAAHARNVEGLREFIAPFDADSRRRGHRARPRGHPPRGPGLRRGAHGDRPHGHRRQHGPPGHAGLLAAHHAQPGVGQPRAPGRRPAARASRPPSTSTSSPSASSTRPSGPVRHLWGHVPGNLLADYITAPTEPLRALHRDRRQPDHGHPRRGAPPRGVPPARARRHHGPLPQRHRRAVRLRAPGERLARAGRLPRRRPGHRPVGAVLRRGGAGGGGAQGGVVDPRRASSRSWACPPCSTTASSSRR